MNQVCYKLSVTFYIVTLFVVKLFHTLFFMDISNASYL